MDGDVLLIDEEFDELVEAFQESEDDKVLEELVASSQSDLDKAVNKILGLQNPCAEVAYTTAIIDPAFDAEKAIASLDKLSNMYLQTKPLIFKPAFPKINWDFSGTFQTTGTTQEAEPWKSGTVLPTQISWYGKSIYPEFHGGKAYSLYKLMCGDYSVPTAWVLPCKLSLERPEVDFSNLPVEAVYAVRSGAPVSMPGLLNTELNVPFEKLPEAVAKVWDSWHSEHAAAYRDAHGISHNLGTGVIIQIMVSDIVAAGVGFTHPPNDEGGQREFHPVIEFVDGVGEALVSGESSGKVATGLEPWYPSLMRGLKSIHTSWGASDVEWCADRWNHIYYVQQRALKFTKPVVQTVQAEEFEGRKILGFFKPIGAPVTMSGILVGTSYEGDFSDKILYVTSFKPAYYKSMMKAKAIICLNGGETCHAAILGREMGKASVSGDAWKPTWSFDANNQKVGQGVVVNGTTGVIYEATPEDLVPSTNVVVVVEDKARTRPNLKVSEIEWNADMILFRFYRALNEYLIKNITEERKNEIVDEIAHILLTHYFVICVGELRHLAGRITSEYRSEFNVLVLELAKRGVKLPVNINSSVGRSGFFSRGGIPQPGSLKMAIEIMDLTYKGFMDFAWPSSHGGPKWGNITKMVQEYLTGELTSTLFVDMSFNLEHNGGRAFNKFGWMMSDTATMNSMLDAKKKSYDSLAMFVKTLCSGGNYSYSSFHRFAVQDKLLPDNLKLGPESPYELLDNPVMWPCPCKMCSCISCWPQGKCDGLETCNRCYPCGCKKCGCRRCFKYTTGKCMKFECTECKCGCENCGCPKCFENVTCNGEKCDMCNPCKCKECGCTRCFAYNYAGKCQSQECTECACDCGACDCSQCNPSNDCGDEDCQTCHPCSCGECECEHCFEDGECNDMDCNTCHPCDCGDCGCERCFPDGGCSESSCANCNPCNQCGEDNCEQCHPYACDCPKCYVDPNQTKLDLGEVEKVQDMVDLPIQESCPCESCKAVKELELVGF